MKVYMDLEPKDLRRGLESEELLALSNNLMLEIYFRRSIARRLFRELKPLITEKGIVSAMKWIRTSDDPELGKNLSFKQCQEICVLIQDSKDGQFFELPKSCHNYDPMGCVEGPDGKRGPADRCYVCGLMPNAH